MSSRMKLACIAAIALSSALVGCVVDATPTPAPESKTSSDLKAMPNGQILVPNGQPVQPQQGIFPSVQLEHVEAPADPQPDIPPPRPWVDPDGHPQYDPLNGPVVGPTDQKPTDGKNGGSETAVPPK